jgi:hypothetical protein
MVWCILLLAAVIVILSWKIYAMNGLIGHEPTTEELTRACVIVAGNDIKYSQFHDVIDYVKMAGFTIVKR